MSREIKFRAWDENSKRMTHTVPRCVSFDDVCLLADMLEGNDGLIPMQFTGLHDKNGKEIYEGDIVKLPLLTSNGILRPLCTVEFMKACFYAVPINESIIKAPHLFGEDVEVIGNIHENPELLEAE